MKKLLFSVLIALLLPMVTAAQNGLSNITLKNGVVLVGTIMSIDPATVVKIEISGVETTINMSDIAKIEEAGSNQTKESATTSVEGNRDKYQKIVVQDYADYPETYDLKIGSQTMKMILVRGGEMNMGYDGDKSMFYDSEPVHLVKVTSFYISADVITNAVVKEVLPDEKYPGDKKTICMQNEYKFFEKVLAAITEKTNLPIRICTEAEWEYAAFSDQKEKIFASYKKREFCSDYFAKFEKFYEVDPTGPSTGKKRVCRSYKNDKRIFKREVKNSNFTKAARLVVKAKDVIR